MAGKNNKQQKPKVQSTKKATMSKAQSTKKATMSKVQKAGKFWTRKKVLVVAGSIASIGVLIAASIGISNLVTTAKQRKCEHEYVFVEKLIAEGCETEGLHLYKCELCDKETKEVALALGHTKKSVEMISPTCKESGWSDYEVCETCNQEWGKVEIPSLGHNLVTDPSKPATCDETGLTEGSHCGRCGEIIVEQNAVPKLKHNIIQVIGKPATCEESGLTNGSKCEYCEKVFVAQEEILPLKHSLEYYTRKEVTCMESGHEAYEECKRDGCDYTTYVEIPLLGHDLENGMCSRCEYVLPENHVHEYTNVTVLKKATCTEAGNARYTCECGDTYTEALEATGHAYDDGQVSKKATCTAVGEMVYTCSVCAAQKTEEIKATGHSYDVETIDPTCEKDGYIRTICGACGDIKQETLTKLGHDYKQESKTEPTCVDNGFIKYTCERCSDTYTETLTALGHNFVGGKCTKCGVDLKAMVVSTDLTASVDGYPLTAGETYTFAVNLQTGNGQLVEVSDKVTVSLNGVGSMILSTKEVSNSTGKVTWYDSTNKEVTLESLKDKFIEISYENGELTVKAKKSLESYYEDMDRIDAGRTKYYTNAFREMVTDCYFTVTLTDEASGLSTSILLRLNASA